MWTERHAASSTIHFNTTYLHKHIAHSGILACVCVLFIYHTQFPCHVQKPFWMLNTTNVLLQINSIVFYSNGEHMLRVLCFNNNKNTEINKKTMKKRNSKVTIESMNESRMSEVLQTTATAVSHRQLLWAATKTADAKLFYLVHFYGISSSPLPISIRCCSMCERACMGMYVIVRLLWIHSKHLCEHWTWTLSKRSFLSVFLFSRMLGEKKTSFIQFLPLPFNLCFFFFYVRSFRQNSLAEKLNVSVCQ